MPVNKEKFLQEFIERATEKHGDKYDYSHAEYENAKTKLKIYCKACEVFFFQTTKNHMHSYGCTKCSRKNQGVNMTFQIFVKKAKEVHGNKYNYEHFEFKSNKDKGDIFCNSCEKMFSLSPHGHIHGIGCPNCNKTRKLSIEDFVRRAKEVHGKKYDYSKFEYKGNKIKATFICNKCNKEFQQTPHHHVVSKQGCPHCKGNVKSTKEEFVKKAVKIHGDKYNYSSFVYVNSRTKGQIYCNSCKKTFDQTPSNHITLEQDCPDCMGCRKMTRETFEEKAIKLHGLGRYGYEEFEYVNNKTRGDIWCHACEDYFEQCPNKHLAGRGCPVCKCKSRGNAAVAKILKSIDLDFEYEYKFEGFKGKTNIPYSFDFYIPYLDICIEYDGLQHFEAKTFGSKVKSGEEMLEILQKRDLIKTAFCKKKKKTLIRIDYTYDPHTDFEALSLLLTEHLKDPPDDPRLILITKKKKNYSFLFD